MDTRKYSNLQEKRIAKKLHGRKQLNSGATMFQKGDVITDKILICLLYTSPSPRD